MKPITLGRIHFPDKVFGQQTPTNPNHSRELTGNANLGIIVGPSSRGHGTLLVHIFSSQNRILWNPQSVTMPLAPKQRYFGFKGGWLVFWITVACATDMTLFGYDQVSTSLESAYEAIAANRCSARASSLVSSLATTFLNCTTLLGLRRPKSCLLLLRSMMWAAS